MLNAADGVQFFSIREHLLDLEHLQVMEFFCENYYYPFVRLAGTNSLFTPQRFEAESREKSAAEEPDEEPVGDAAEEMQTEAVGEMSKGFEGDD